MPTFRDLMFQPLESASPPSATPRCAAAGWEAVEDPDAAQLLKRWDLVYIREVARPEHRAWRRAQRGRRWPPAAGQACSTPSSTSPWRKTWTRCSRAATCKATRRRRARSCAARTSWSASPTRAPTWPTTRGSATARSYSATTRATAAAMPLEEAVRKLTFMPGVDLRPARPRAAAPGLAADLVVFDPATVIPRQPELVARPAGG